MSGISVESLKLPLMIRQNAYESEYAAPHEADRCERLHPDRCVQGAMVDAPEAVPTRVKGLSDWLLNVFSPDDVNAWLVTKPLAQRVEIIAANSRQSMAARLKDKAMASKQRAVFESKLTALLSAINSLPPQ
eukprot:60791-Prymnesium_polylepis.1